MKEQRMVPVAEPTSYYGRPVIKEPTWKWMIPAYFFAGGLSSGSALLAAAGRVRGNHTMARAADAVALSSIGIGGVLLVADLGKPKRFLNMLRVVKPTSPMSVGTWLLSLYGPASGVAALCSVTGRLPRTGRMAGAAAALLAPLIATYTAVLVADTAVPAWHEAGADLPFVFAAGAAVSAGGVVLALVGPERGAIARRMAVLGVVAELGAMKRMERRLGELGAVYREGRAHQIGRRAKMALAGGGAAVVLGGRRRWLSTAGGLALAAGAAGERFAVFEAGMQSARDPKYTVGPQRKRLGDQASQKGFPPWD